MSFHQNFKWIALIIMWGAVNVYAIDEYSPDIDPMLDSTTQSEDQTGGADVTAVYGIGTDDYLPKTEQARRHLRPQVRERNSHPNFNLPDGFYFIGGPIFLLILLRVLSMFLNEFEEKRKEEQNVAVSEHLPGERFADE